LGPLCIFATVEASNFKFGTQIGFGTSVPKTFRTKISGGMGCGSTHKNWDPLRIGISATGNSVFLTVNLKFGTQIWFGTSLPKTTVRTKIGGGLG